MFAEKDFVKLHSIWDGKSSNVSKICGPCGLCCTNVNKTLFPGEYDLAVKLTGQHNSDWKSVGCLCYALKDAYKPIICKLFPLNLQVTLKEQHIDWEGEISDYYSTNCKKLVFTKADRQKAEAFVKFFFSDIDNVVFYLLCFSLHDNIDNEKTFQKENGQSGTFKNSWEKGLWKTFLPLDVCRKYFESWK